MATASHLDLDLWLAAVLDASGRVLEHLEKQADSPVPMPAAYWAWLAGLLRDAGVTAAGHGPYDPAEFPAVDE